jgi:hypothetical protein
LPWGCASRSWPISAGAGAFRLDGHDDPRSCRAHRQLRLAGDRAHQRDAAAGLTTASMPLLYSELLHGDRGCSLSWSLIGIFT